MTRHGRFLSFFSALHGDFREWNVNIYVGNIPYRFSEDELRETFEAHGEVSSASIIMDRETGRSKGFGFVEMPNDDEAKSAIETLDGQDCGGRPLRVNEARPRGDRPRRR